MTAKALILAVSAATLFNLPVCCCLRLPHAGNSQGQQEPCGHCPKKRSTSPSTPHSKECRCPHATRDASVDFGKLTIAKSTAPDAWEPSLPPALAAPGGILEVDISLNRGPPPERPGVPLYLLILHLAL